MRWLAATGFIVIFSAQAEPDMCFIKAGHDYGIDPLLLTAISIKESHLKMDAVNNKNRNRTEDVCGMQVNSIHFPALAKFDITRERLMKDPCICIYSGAWVLAHNFRAYGRNWDSVGMYNTGANPKLVIRRRAYAQDVKDIYRVLLARNIIYRKMSVTDEEKTISNESENAPPETRK